MVIQTKTIDTVLTLSPSHKDEFVRFGQRINRLGGEMVVANSEGQILLYCDDVDQVRSDDFWVSVTRRTLDQIPNVASNPGASHILDSSLPCQVAVGMLTLQALCASTQDNRVFVILTFGDSERHSKEDFAPFYRELLTGFIDSFGAVVSSNRQMELVGAELSQVYEELVLLHKLSTHMKVTESDANFLQLACDSLTEVVAVEGIAIVVERWVEHKRRWMVVAGSGLIDLDEIMACAVFARLQEEIGQGREALLDSEVFGAFKYDWHETIRNIIAVPLYGKDTQESQLVQHSDSADTMIGYMVAVNALDKQDFDSTDIKLFNSVANRCAVFIENGRLFGDLQELFMGSLRALTSSIDAKDGYTHGHSERVALICRWIAEHAAEADLLTPEQVHEAYFVGLLHDIGKIGIEDWVLRKGGPLTPEELDCIHNHPNIGAGILRGIKQMRDIVPGVMHHHERYDGRGYPQGLTGQDIPVLARIVGLADSFDAMTSRRSYRQARSIEEAAEDIRRHLGTQFDPEIGAVFLASDLQRLWELMQGGSDFHYGREAADYGATAVGTLIR
jgi:HD-GYP domain-containing protein (c-di-GMP phosphodiesterase class II)